MLPVLSARSRILYIVSNASALTGNALPLPRLRPPRPRHCVVEAHRTRAPPGSWHRPSAVRAWRFWLDDRITRLESLRCSLRSSLGPRTEHAREPSEADRTPPRSSPPSQFAEINPPQRRRVLP